MAETIHDDSGTPKTEDVKTFTQEEVNKIVSERVNKLNASQQAQIDDALAKAKAEWEEQKRIEGLNGEKRVQAEYDAMVAKAEKERKSLADELSKARNELAISKAQAQLASLGLPPEFAPYMVADSDEQTSQNIQTFDAKVQELVAQKVNESLSRGTPRMNGEGAPQTDDELARLRKIAHLA